MEKQVATFALIGVFAGIILPLFFPSIFNFEFAYNILFRNHVQIPTYSQYSSGSVFVVGILTPIVLGLVGAFMGRVFYKIKR